MRGIAAKRDYGLVLIIGIIVGIFSVPILENIDPPFWELTLANVALLVIGFSAFSVFALWVAGIIGLKSPGLYQFAKYGAAGAMNSATDVGILNFLSYVFQIFSGGGIIILNVIAFTVAVTNSYFWNNLWVFKRDGAGLSMNEYMKFFGVTVTGIAINTAIVFFLTTYTAPPGAMSPQLWENVAKLIAMPASVAWNFIGYKFFVFALAKKREIA